MGAPATVRVDDDLAASQPSITMRTSNHKPARAAPAVRSAGHVTCQTALHRRANSVAAATSLVSQCGNAAVIAYMAAAAGAEECQLWTIQGSKSWHPLESSVADLQGSAGLCSRSAE